MDAECLFPAGLLPAAVQLLLIFPLGGMSIGGVRLGYCMPLFVILFNTIFWSFPAYAWFTATGQVKCFPSAISQWSGVVSHTEIHSIVKFGADRQDLIWKTGAGRTFHTGIKLEGR